MAVEQTNTWAILDKHDRPLCEYDSIDELSDDASATVPVEPQENGALYSYDKVPMPNNITVTLLFSGNYSTQQAALDRIDQALRSTEVFTVVTPSSVRTNLTLTGVSATRASENGANFLSVDLTFQEVRSAKVGGGSVAWSPKKATSAKVVDGGKRSTTVLGGLFS